MKSGKLKDHVNDYYQSQQLSDDKLSELIGLTNEANNTKVDKPVTANKRLFLFQQRYALVASLMFFVVSIWGVVNFEQNKSYKANFSLLVAQEIALNHRKELAPDYLGQDFVNLASLMNKLDFKVVNSKHLNLTGLNVIGARYCSIQGNIAVQFRLVNAEGKLFTLYQTKLTDLLKEAPDATQLMDQIEVKQWQEKDLFFGLAESV